MQTHKENMTNKKRNNKRNEDKINMFSVKYYGLLTSFSDDLYRVCNRQAPPTAVKMRHINVSAKCCPANNGVQPPVKRILCRPK